MELYKPKESIIEKYIYDKNKKLSEVIKDTGIIEIAGDLDIHVKGIHSDSRKIKEGYIFFAINGFTQKGSAFIESAVKNGAKAIICEKEESVEEISKKYNVVACSSENVRKTLALCAKNYYDDPSKDMYVIGITGTKGKSTTTSLIRDILVKDKEKALLVGSIGGYLNYEKISNNTRTTPESFEIFKMLSYAKENGAKYAVLEVSSQSMITERVTGISFDITGFTNFSEDHISEIEHPNLEAYFKAKTDAVLLAKKNILNADDEMVISLKNMLEKRGNTVITTGIENDANVFADNITLEKDRSNFDISITGKEIEEYAIGIQLSIPGMFNIYNCLMATAVANEIGIDTDIIAETFENVKVMGRLEPVENDLGLTILLDYAHTANSLENVLKTIKPNVRGKLICAWGVGGNRDKEKRPIMGRISGKYADYTILMSDQVRNEDPLKILQDIEKGLKEVTDNYEIIVDRREGIKKAIQMATKEDVIVIPGFGHDMYQEIAGVKYYFNEREVIRDIISELKGK